MYTDILKETKIIVIILRAAPVVTVARTIIITAWDIFRSIAMVMAVPILTSISMKTTMIAAAAMTMVLMRLMNTMSTMSTRMMTVAAGTSTTIMSMRSMNTMTVAAGMSIIMGMNTMFRDIPMTANVSFAIPMRSIAMFAAKA